MTDKQLREIAKWIASLNDRVAAPLEAQTELYTYTLKDGKTLKLDFPLFVEGKGQKVTKNPSLHTKRQGVACHYRKRYLSILRNPV